MKEKRMGCNDDDTVKPLDELLDDQRREFESGGEIECDKDLDVMMWKLGDYENQEPPEESELFRKKPPIEEELVEKELHIGENGRAFYSESGPAEEAVGTGGKFAEARSIGPARGGNEGGTARRRKQKKTFTCKKS